jgi:hypothetical protein
LCLRGRRAELSRLSRKEREHHVLRGRKQQLSRKEPELTCAEGEEGIVKQAEQERARAHVC